MKIFIYLFIILFLLNACQGRSMPMHTSDKKEISNIRQTHKSTLNQTEKIILPIPIIKKKVPTKILATKKKNIHIQNTKKKLPVLPLLPPIHKVKKKIKKLNKTISNTKYLPQSNINNKFIQTSCRRESFSGGGISSGLDISTIRIGKSSDYTSIIFDSYIYAGESTLPTKKAPVSGTYLFTYEPEKQRIVGILDGYNAFSALLTDQSALFKGNPIVKNIYILQHIKNDGIKFVIKLKKDVKVNIFDVKGPGRIIVNLFPQ